VRQQLPLSAGLLERVREYGEGLRVQLPRVQEPQVTDSHAASFWKKGEWKAAHEVYARALKQLPGDKHLIERGGGVWERQARVHLARKEWKEALAIYEEGLKSYPDDFYLKNNHDVCKQRLERSK
jgi:tetratricopeptide (TPR) repeat protein